MKSAGEVMDIIAAYRQVGTYRGAAVMCGTTHKTVRRVVERAESGGTRPGSSRFAEIRPDVAFTRPATRSATES
jgi:hypothetical protein